MGDQGMTCLVYTYRSNGSTAWGGRACLEADVSKQLLEIWNKAKTKERDAMLWGDEVYPTRLSLGVAVRINRPVDRVSGRHVFQGQSQGLVVAPPGRYSEGPGCR
jgi:hypothetical protein